MVVKDRKYAGRISWMVTILVCGTLLPAITVTVAGAGGESASAVAEVTVNVRNTGSEKDRLRALAERGEVEAQYELGNLYLSGKEGTGDRDKGYRWHHKAAEQGHPEAQASLGYMYFQGRGVPLDLEKAVRWFRRAAEQGHPRARYMLGLCYAMGKGVSQDAVLAYKWFQLAADQGDLEAADYRDRIAENMTGEQLDEARTMAAKEAKTGS